MKRRLVTILLVGFVLMLVGCAPDSSTTLSRRVEYDKAIQEWCAQVIPQREQIYTAVQMDRKQGLELANKLMEAEQAVDYLYQTKQTDWYEIASDIRSAGTRFHEYCKTGDMKSYAQGVQFFNCAYSKYHKIVK